MWRSERCGYVRDNRIWRLCSVKPILISETSDNVGDPQLRLFDMKARWETYNVAWPASCLDSLNHLQYYRSTTWQPTTPDNAKWFSAIAYYYGRMLRDSLKVPVGLICNAVGGSPTEAWIDRNTLKHAFQPY